MKKPSGVITRPKKGVGRQKGKTTWDKLHASTLISRTTFLQKRKASTWLIDEKAIKGIQNNMKRQIVQNTH